MTRSCSWPLDVRRRNDHSAWPSAESHDFLGKLQSKSEAALLRRQLARLADGISVACRGRDATDDVDWDYGYCTKQGTYLHFEYASGDKECFLISGVNFFDLVHLGLKKPKGSASATATAKPVVILAHGWSPQVGPHYPLIRRLEDCAKEKGCEVIVPDFRSAYAYGERRARAERVKQIYEELLVTLASRTKGSSHTPLVLVGHSQGAAAVAYACTPKLCSSLDIRGVLLLGPEDPTAHDNMNWRPPVKHLGVVHAVDDATIDIRHIRRLARKWHCEFTELSSRVAPKGAVTSHGDDIHHDFLASDLMSDVTIAFEKFLYKCSTPE